jgi:hypothetical protein
LKGCFGETHHTLAEQLKETGEVLKFEAEISFTLKKMKKRVCVTRADATMRL